MEDLDHVLSGYIEALVAQDESFQIYFPGGCIGMKVAYFEERYPGLLLGADFEDNEVMIPLSKVSAVRTMDDAKRG